MAGSTTALAGHSNQIGVAQDNVIVANQASTRPAQCRRSARATCRGLSSPDGTAIDFGESSTQNPVNNGSMSASPDEVGDRVSDQAAILMGLVWLA